MHSDSYHFPRCTSSFCWSFCWLISHRVLWVLKESCVQLPVHPKMCFHRCLLFIASDFWQLQWITMILRSIPIRVTPESLTICTPLGLPWYYCYNIGMCLTLSSPWLNWYYKMSMYYFTWFWYHRLNLCHWNSNLLTKRQYLLYKNPIASLTSLCTYFGSDSYCRQYAHYSLHSFKHEVPCTSTSYEFKQVVLYPYRIQKLHLKCRLMSENCSKLLKI